MLTRARSNISDTTWSVTVHAFNGLALECGQTIPCSLASTFFSGLFSRDEFSLKVTRFTRQDGQATRFSTRFYVEEKIEQIFKSFDRGLSVFGIFIQPNLFIFHVVKIQAIKLADKSFQSIEETSLWYHFSNVGTFFWPRGRVVTLVSRA